MDNTQDFETGCAVGKESIIKLLNTKIKVFMLPGSEDRIKYRYILKELEKEDPSDLSHAIIALKNSCDCILTYDHHFDSISSVIEVKTPEKILEIKT